MGLSSGKPVHAGHRPWSRGRHDPRQAVRQRKGTGGGNGGGLIRALIRAPIRVLAVLLAFLAAPLRAEDLRIAVWNTELASFGPGILLSNLKDPDDAQVNAFVAGAVALNADVLLVVDFDWDLRGEALAALRERLEAAGVPYAHAISFRPNGGAPSGLDLNGDGQMGQAEDALGYGRFPGQGGMVLLSRLPVLADATRDFTGFLWKDLPGHLMPPLPSEVLQSLPLSSSGHWDVALRRANGQVLHALVFSATPPVFDGPEDFNGRRNHDEAAFWLAYLDGHLPDLPPEAPVMVLGTSNLDPVDGEGRPGALMALMAHPRLQPLDPRGAGGHVDEGQSGDPALDTAYFDRTGGLRVDIVLPPAGALVAGAGVLWPPAGDPLAPVLDAASRHRPVYVDIRLD